MSKATLPSDPFLNRIEDEDPKLYLDILYSLIKYKVANKSIARHGRTPREVLSAMLKDSDPPVYEILQHPNCPREVLEANLLSQDSINLISLASNPILNQSQIEILAKGDDVAVKMHLSRRSDLSEGVIRELFEWAKKESREETEQWSSIAENTDEEATQKTSWFYGIAKNPDTPRDIIEALLKFDLKAEDYDGTTLGQVLMSNPALSDEDRALLSINGIPPKKSESHDVNMLEHEGLPSSRAFEIRDFPIQFIQELAKAGHPFALFHPDLPLREFPTSFNDYLDHFIKSEIIYRTLWPELINRGDTKFFYLRSSYDGDALYFYVPGLTLEHNFMRGELTYNSMSFPFIDREWVEVNEEIDVDDVVELFNNRTTFDGCINYDDTADCLLAFSISHAVSSNEAELTERGREFLQSEGSTYFDDDVDYHARILPEKALPYSWKRLSEEKRIAITKMLIEGFNEKVDTKYQFAEHFLVCIALLPSTSDATLSLLEKVDSLTVREALNISNPKLRPI